ncbi:thioredoxin [Neisseria sp. P0021.S005]|uniref:thioredoxin n=1 Tax=Neisseria sp. P0021.S005 TaxID=3436820 RepID=UPI003F804AFA
MPKPSPEELAAFAKHVAAFIPTTPDELMQLIDSHETAIAFLGKPSCSYCRRFVAKLFTVYLNKQLTIRFTDSSNKAALKTLSEQHGINTVPALLTIPQGKIKFVCNSKLSEEEIEAFLSA